MEIMLKRNRLLAFDLNLLPILYAVLTEKHVTRAALRLGMSQPKVSKALEKLRRYYQDALLERKAGGYELTQVGQRALKAMREALPALQGVLGETHFDASTAVRNFKVAMSAFGARVVTPKLSEALRNTHVTLHCYMHSDETLRETKVGSIDMMLYEHDPPRSMSCISIADVQLKCIVRRDHPFKGDRFSLREFVDCTHIAFSVPGYEKTLIDCMLERYACKRRSNIVTPYIGAGVWAAVTTDTVVTVPAPMASSLERRQLIRVVDPPKEICSLKLSLVWSPVFDSDSGHVWLRETLRNIASSVLQQ